MGAMAVAIGYALKAQPLRCFPLCKWVLRPISWAERTARRLQAPFPIFVFAASCFRTCNVGKLPTCLPGLSMPLPDPSLYFQSC